MNKPVATPQRTKEIMKKYDLHARKGFGQNFLIDPVRTKQIAELSRSEDAVIEIGPGIGSLTEQLALISKHVRAYEIDLRLKEVLEDTLAPYDNVEIIFQDILEADIAGSAAELKEKYGRVSVCANLPYYITTPVLFRLFENGQDIDTITVMVQKEVGERISAEVNDKEYSALSVECQYLYDVEKVLDVPKTCFMPSPKVDSIILRFTKKEVPDTEEEKKAFFAFVKACFKQRRKTIFNNLKEIQPDAEKIRNALERADIDPGVRAQQLTIEQVRKLYKEFS